MSKSKSTKKFPYDELHEFVKNERKKKEGKSSAIEERAYGVLVSVYIFSVALSMVDPIGAIGFAVTFGLISFTITKILRLTRQNINSSGESSSYICRVLTKFHAQSSIFTEEEIDNINRRANNGKNAGSLQTLLPLIAIPLLASPINNMVGSFDRADVIPFLIIFSLISVFIFVFLRQLDKTNADIIILYAISEYQKQRKYAQATERRTEADEMTLRAIVEAKQKCPYTQANEKRTSAEVSRLIRVHGTPVHQHHSQPSVASTNGVRADDKAARRPSNV